MRCDTCSGTGRIARRILNPDGSDSPATVIVPCEACLGGQTSCCGDSMCQPEDQEAVASE